MLVKGLLPAGLFSGEPVIIINQIIEVSLARGGVKAGCNNSLAITT
jgi:hypothetical protein